MAQSSWLLEQDGADEADARMASSGKMPTTLVRRLISLLSRSSGLVEADLAPVRCREGGEGEDVGLGLVEDASARLGNCVVEDRATTSCSWCGHVLGVGLGEDRADGRRRPCPSTLGATVPSRLRIRWTLQRCQLAPDEHRAIDGLQAGVGVGDHQAAPRAGRGPSGRAGTPSRTPRPRCRRHQRRAPHGPRCAVTPVATTTARDTIRWLLRALT